MSARDIVGGLAGAAVGAVKHPVGTAGEAISKAKGAVSAGTAVGTAVAGSVVGKVRGGAGEAKDKAGEAKDKAGEAKDKAGEATSKAGAKAKEAVKDPAGTAKETAVKTAAAAKATTDVAADVAADAARTTAAKATRTAKQGAKKAEADKAGTKAPAAKKSAPKKGTKSAAKKPAKREPQVVLAEPAPPLEPPIDVVGQALAAEAEESFGAGRATEPRGGSRDEEHGEASLQRAEAAEIAAEVAEASGLDIDIETPVGTTGADVGNNPSTAEADLQQPGTEPLLDPSVVKSVKSEQDTLRKAAKSKK